PTVPIHVYPLSLHDALPILRRLVAAIVAMLAVAAGPAPAHEIPDAVKVEAFFRPAGQRLELLMRVPMSALIEVDFPTRGPGYIKDRKSTRLNSSHRTNSYAV